jgi:hypothetical protein
VGTRKASKRFNSLDEVEAKVFGYPRAEFFRTFAELFRTHAAPLLCRAINERCDNSAASRTETSVMREELYANIAANRSRKVLRFSCGIPSAVIMTKRS